MTQRILLPFDGSPAAVHAVHHLARELKGRDATVLLVNVQRVYVDAEMAHEARSIASLHRHEGEETLRPAMDILDAHGIRHDAEVVFGPPAAAIARIGDERGFSLIAMGTRARHPLVEFLARSVAKRVTRLARVPVLLVRHEPVHAQLPPQVRAPFIAA